MKLTDKMVGKDLSNYDVITFCGLEISDDSLISDTDVDNVNCALAIALTLANYEVDDDGWNTEMYDFHSRIVIIEYQYNRSSNDWDIRYVLKDH